WRSGTHRRTTPASFVKMLHHPPLPQHHNGASRTLSCDEIHSGSLALLARHPAGMADEETLEWRQPIDQAEGRAAQQGWQHGVAAEQALDTVEGVAGNRGF